MCETNNKRTLSIECSQYKILLTNEKRLKRALKNLNPNNDNELQDIIKMSSRNIDYIKEIKSFKKNIYFF